MYILVKKGQIIGSPYPKPRNLKLDDGKTISLAITVSDEKLRALGHYLITREVYNSTTKVIVSKAYELRITDVLEKLTLRNKTAEELAAASKVPIKTETSIYVEEHPTAIWTPNIANGTYFKITIAIGTTINLPINMTEGQQFFYEITNGGNYSNTWEKKFAWSGGTEPTLTTNGKDVLQFIYNGVEAYGKVFFNDIKKPTVVEILK